ncbi:MAG: hypothetical protein JSW37_09770 [Anaerolineales bacterium]|nr:MAG: hypothetical protein JSW37_09770 [Anaerolineales bacterium]
MREEQRRYLSYLLRLWQVGSGAEGVWRASLEDPHTGEHKGFGSLEDLFEFLGEQTTGGPAELSREDQSEDGT